MKSVSARMLLLSVCPLTFFSPYGYETEKGGGYLRYEDLLQFYFRLWRPVTKMAWKQTFMMKVGGGDTWRKVGGMFKLHIRTENDTFLTTSKNIENHS